MRDNPLSSPYQRAVVLRIYRLNVLHGEFPVEHPLVERHGEAGVDELSMVEGHGYEAPDKLEVVKVVGVDVRGRVDLEAVVVLVGVFEQAVHRVQHLVRQSEEPFPEKVEMSVKMGLLKSL